MSDLISRQAAIDALNVGAELLRRVLDSTDIVGVEREKYEWGLGLIESYISDMNELPSVQREWKKGRWIKNERGFWTFVNKDGERDGWIPDYECSECGSSGWKYVDNMNFCPQCGADMREGNNE